MHNSKADGGPGQPRASLLAVGLAPLLQGPPSPAEPPCELGQLGPCPACVQPSQGPVSHTAHLAPFASLHPEGPRAHPAEPPRLGARLYSDRSLESSPSPTLSWPQLFHLQSGLKNMGEGPLRRTGARDLGSSAGCVTVDKGLSLPEPWRPGGGEPTLLLWGPGAWAWLRDLERASVFPSAQWGGRGWTDFPGSRSVGLPPSFPGSLSPSPMVALDVRPLWLPCLVPGPSTAWLSPPRSLCLSLSPPPSLPLLSCRALALSSLLCVSGPPLQPDLVHIQMAAKVLAPPHAHPGPGDPTVWGAPPAPVPSPPLPPPPLGAVGVEVPWARGLCPLSHPLT